MFQGELVASVETVVAAIPDYMDAAFRDKVDLHLRKRLA